MAKAIYIQNEINIKEAALAEVKQKLPYLTPLERVDAISLIVDLTSDLQELYRKLVFAT